VRGPGWAYRPRAILVTDIAETVSRLDSGADKPGRMAEFAVSSEGEERAAQRFAGG
jgi:hypothetical protein